MTVIFFFLQSTVLDAMGAEKPPFNVGNEQSVSIVSEFAGSKFIYRREGDKESLNALGPLKERIMVKVSSHRDIFKNRSPFSVFTTTCKNDNTNIIII